MYSLCHSSLHSVMCWLKSTGIACLLAIVLPSITCGVASSHNVKQCVTQNKKSPCLYILSISTHEYHVGYCNVYIQSNAKYYHCKCCLDLSVCLRALFNKNCLSRTTHVYIHMYAHTHGSEIPTVVLTTIYSVSLDHRGDSSVSQKLTYASKIATLAPTERTSSGGMLTVYISVEALLSRHVLGM